MLVNRAIDRTSGIELKNSILFCFYPLSISKDRKIVLSRDVTFDESFMVKTPSSQQVESDQTSEISQQVKNDASPPSPDSSVLFRVSSVVTQYEHHVYEGEDTEDVIENQELWGQVQDSIAANKPKRKYESRHDFQIW